MNAQEKTAGGLNYSRQYGIFRPDQAADPVTIIGAGGIGSPTALLLAKMGVPDITIYDFDSVQDENRASQFFRKEDLGLPKVHAVAAQCESHADRTITAKNERYVDQPLSGVVIAAVDSMDMRVELWKNQVRLNPNISLYIDGRMGGQIMRVFALRPYEMAEVKRYEQFLCSSAEAATLPCTERAICYTTFGIAALIAATCRRWWVKGEINFEYALDLDSFTSHLVPS